MLKRMSLVMSPKDVPKPEEESTLPKLPPDATLEQRRALFPFQWPANARDHFTDTPQTEEELDAGIVVTPERCASAASRPPRESDRAAGCARRPR